MIHICTPLLNNLTNTPLIPTPSIPVYNDGILLENLEDQTCYEITRRDRTNNQIDTSIPYNPNAIVQARYVTYKNRIYYNNVIIAKLSPNNAYVDGAWGPIDVLKLPLTTAVQSWREALDIRYQYLPAYGGTREYTVWRPENSLSMNFRLALTIRRIVSKPYNSIRVTSTPGWFYDHWSPTALFSRFWSNSSFHNGIPNEPSYNGIYIWSSVNQKISIILHLIQGQSAYNLYYPTVVPYGSGHPL